MKNDWAWEKRKIYVGAVKIARMKKGGRKLEQLCIDVHYGENKEPVWNQSLKDDWLKVKQGFLHTQDGCINSDERRYVVCVGQDCAEEIKKKLCTIQTLPASGIGYRERLKVAVISTA